MIIVTISHHIRDGSLDTALQRISDNGTEMAAQPGFVFRHTGSPADAPLTVVTVTAWASRGDMDTWDALKKARSAGADAGASVYERVERLVIDVFDRRDSAPQTQGAA